MRTTIRNGLFVARLAARNKKWLIQCRTYGLAMRTISSHEKKWIIIWHQKMAHSNRTFIAKAIESGKYKMYPKCESPNQVCDVSIKKATTPALGNLVWHAEGMTIHRGVQYEDLYWQDPSQKNCISLQGRAPEWIYQTWNIWQTEMKFMLNRKIMYRGLRKQTGSFSVYTLIISEPS